MLNWESVFKKKIAEYKPWDKWTLTKDLENRQVQHGLYRYEQKNLFARFKCSNCSRSWKSARATVLFHMLLDCSSGQVKMRAFGQKCDRCASPKYEEPSFRDDTIVFVLHNLVRKILQKCYRETKGIPSLPPPVSEDILEGPHKSENCEACKHGFCLRGGTPPFLGHSFQWEKSVWEPSSLTRPIEREANRESLGEIACCFVLVAVVFFLLLLSISRK